METKKLGGTGLAVSAMGLGCMGMSEFYGPYNDDDSVKTIRRALDLGINFLDTADIYGKGNNERLVGRAVKGRRADVVIATKFGIVRGEDVSRHGVSGKPEYVRSACEASLKRLEVDYIDLYLQHRVDPATPIEETVGAMADLIREGKIRYVGLSEASAETVRRAHAVHPVTAVQTEYSLWTRDVERDILPVCRELGIGFVAYSPLGRGFLTGGIKKTEDLAEDDWRRLSPRFHGENLEQNLALLHQVEEIAAQKGCTSAQLALAWVLAKGKDIVPIPGTKRIKYLEENVGASKVTLSREDMDRLEKTAPVGATAGTRYPEGGMRLLNG